MPLRDALRLLDGRFDGQPAVWLVGLAFGLVLGAGLVVTFVVDAPVTNLVGYALFSLSVAPLFGAALWPYARGDPPESVAVLASESLRRYPRLLAARVGHVLLLGLTAGALVSSVGVLATLVSLGNYLGGGGATTLASEPANGVAFLTVALLSLVGVSTGRVLFGFLDAATLRRERLRGSLGEALSTALRSPGRVVVASLGLAVYRVGTPLVTYLVVSTAVRSRRPWEVMFGSPELAVLPASASSYASPPTPSLSPELLAAFVVVNALVTAAVWPVALGYHLTLFETLRSGGGETPTDDTPGVTTEAVDT